MSRRMGVAFCTIKAARIQENPGCDYGRCKSMRKSQFWTVLVLAALAVSSAAVGLARTQTLSAPDSDIYRQLHVFGEVLERVRTDYVDKPDDAKLIESAINGMAVLEDFRLVSVSPEPQPFPPSPMYDACGSLRTHDSRM